MVTTKRIWNATAAWHSSGRLAWAKRQARLLALSSAAFVLAGNVVSAATFYVATNGNDLTNSGDIDHPFATLEKARDTMRSSGGGTVYVRGGTYCRTNTFTLTAADSGTTWMNYSGETPIIVGGLPIVNFGTWQTNILVTDVSTQGFGGIHFRQLLFNGTRQPLARFPNYIPASSQSTNGWNFVAGSTSGSSSQFTYNNGDIHNYGNPTEAEIVIFPSYNYWNDILRVVSIDATTNTVSLATNADLGAIGPNDRYFIQNVIEELDAPGEWYLDRTNKYLYFYPPSPVSGALVYAPIATNLLMLISGTSNVIIQGFTLQCSSGAAIVLTGTTNCLVAANKISNVGGYSGKTGSMATPGYDGLGVSVNGGYTNGVVGNDLSYIGSSAIWLSGGDEITLAPANNYADNNFVHDPGVLYKQGVGVWVNGVGNRASHNLIRNGPRFGIYFRGQNHIIEYNHIHNVMQETDDGGMIYSEGLNWLGCWGCIVRGNYLHDSTGFGWASWELAYGTPISASGIYLDSVTCGVDVLSNIVTRTSGNGLFVNGGSENRFVNNVIAQCQPSTWRRGQVSQQIEMMGYPTNSFVWSVLLPIFNDAYYSVSGQPAWSSMRGFTNYSAPTNINYSYSGSTGYTMSSNLFWKNIVTYSNSIRYTFSYFASSVNFDRNTCNSNVVYQYGAPLAVWLDSGQALWNTWQALPEDVNSSISDPLLNPDFSLQQSSAAPTLGIQSISTNNIGPYNDRLRASWPVADTSGPRPGPPSNLRIVWK